MIHVIEGPMAAPPSAWFAFDEHDFARKVVATDSLESWEIHDRITPLELLEAGGLQPGETARATCPEICALGERHGWDRMLYRADHLLGRGVLRAEPVSLREAMVAALRARGNDCRIYWDDVQALAAFEGADPWLQGRQNWHKRRALHEQLVALELLADDN